MWEAIAIFCTIRIICIEKKPIPVVFVRNFFSKANLNRHILVKHKDLAPVEYPVCYKGFSRKDVMKKHMKDVHFRIAATEVKSVKDNFPCDFCKKQFTTLQNLKCHKKNVHFIISDSRIQIEDKKSSDANTMNDIINDNSDSSSTEVKFVCEPCETSFSNKFSYTRHMKLPEHGPKEFKCPEIKFRTTQELRDSLLSAISANDGSITDLNKIGKYHRNMIGPPIYEFQHTDDHCPPLMHDNDGVGMDLIGITRKKCKKIDKAENYRIKSETKLKLEMEISDHEEHLETMVDAIVKHPIREG